MALAARPVQQVLPVRHGERMILHRPALLVLAAVLATSGCVAVPSHTPPPASPTRAAAAAPLSEHVAPVQPSGRSSLARTEDAPKHKTKKRKKPHKAKHQVQRPAPHTAHRQAYAPPARTHHARPAPPPARKRKVRPQPHLPHHSTPHRTAIHPRPRPTYQMRDLCAASDHVTNSQVTSLCHSSYGN